MQPHPGTIPELLDQSAIAHPRKLVMVMRAGLRDDRWSYARLRHASHAIAAALGDMGLQHQDRVLLQAANSPELVAAMFGCLRAGLVLVPLDVQCPSELMGSIARTTDAAAMITSGSASAPDGVKSIPLERFRGLSATASRITPVKPDDLAEIVFTSGTTGHPKGVQLTHGNIASNVRSAGVLPNGADHRLVSLLPLSHMLEQTGGLFFPLSTGGSIAYTTSRQSSAVLRELRARRPTTLVVVPQILALLLKRIENEFQQRGRSSHWRLAHRVAPYLPVQLRRALFLPVHQALGGSLRWIFSGGAALSPDVQTAWENLGVTVMQGYGATECAPFVSCNRAAATVPGSIGRPLPGLSVKLAEDGELLVRGPNVTPGYWGDSATTAEVIRDGWYHTGDLARAGDDGELYLLGRKRELIALPNGMNVYPTDIEAALAGATALKAWTVVGWSATGEPAVHAVIVPAEDADDAHIDAVIRSANARLANHQRITGWTKWPEPELPCTATLKVRKHEVIRWLDQRHREADNQRSEPAAKSSLSRTADRLLSLLADVSKRSPDSITAESDLAADLGLDSLARVELAVTIEQELGIQIGDESIAQARTVVDLHNAIMSESPSAPSEPLARWPWTRAATTARELIQQAVLFRLLEHYCQPLRIHGGEQLSTLRPPVLLIANHTSHLDAPLVLRALPRSWRRRTAVAAARDYFFRDFWLGTGASLAIGAFPLAREGPILPSLEACGQLVDRGWSVLVFPEGTRSPTGQLQAFKPGIGLLARDLRVPVVPIAIHGADAILPKGSSWPAAGPATVTIGQAISPDPGRTPDQMTEELHASLESLLKNKTSLAERPSIKVK